MHFCCQGSDSTNPWIDRQPDGLGTFNLCPWIFSVPDTCRNAHRQAWTKADAKSHCYMLVGIHCADRCSLELCFTACDPLSFRCRRSRSFPGNITGIFLMDTSERTWYCSGN